MRKYEKWGRYWEYFIWDKIWQKCEKNNEINKVAELIIADPISML